MAFSIPQNYPRIEDENDPNYGCLDVSTLVPHQDRISSERLQAIIKQSIVRANQKSGREILAIPADATPTEVQQIYIKTGKDLFRYLKHLPDFPTDLTMRLLGKSYIEVGQDVFHNWQIHQRNIHAGWRYRYIAADVAGASDRFSHVSEISDGAIDFHTVIDTKDSSQKPINICVSVKSKQNIFEAADWSKAIHMLDSEASELHPRYCCVIGMVIDNGGRFIKADEETGWPYSVNAEVWLADFFWPFFTNYSYSEVMMATLDVVMSSDEADKYRTEDTIPEMVLEHFGQACYQFGLVNSKGIFDDSQTLVQFFAR